MKKLLLLLGVCSTMFSFSQTTTHYNCNFTSEMENGCSYTKLIREDFAVRMDYFNCQGNIVKSEHYTNKYDIDKDHLHGLQILYNYDGTVYSSGYFKLGKKDSLWEVNLRDSTKKQETFKSGILWKSISLNKNNDTISKSYFEPNTKKEQPLSKTYFADNGNPCKIIWYGYSGKDSIVHFIENGSVRIVDYKDSFKTDDDTLSPSQQVVRGFSEIMPKFKGDNNGLSDYISDNLVYPKRAFENDICGLVKIMFVIDIDGSVKNVYISDLVPAQHPDLEKEALRLIEKSSGMWEPGKQDGKLVKVLCVIPIEFTIE